MSYQRARSPEHKEERREAILAAARALASARAVRDVSLGDIARHVDLAKSNVLRYFESREDIFLTLLRREWEAWNAAASAQPDAAGLAATLAARPFFCDLLSEQAAVLERNVSADTVRTFRAATIELVRALAERVVAATGLDSDDANEVVAATLIITSGLWPLANPAPPVRAIFAGTPELLDTGFERRLRDLVATLIAGYSAR